MLAAQYYADSAEELAERTDALAHLFEGQTRRFRACVKSLTAAAKDDFWKVRKAGVSLLMGMVGDAKPVAFVEDTAVSHEKLARVLRPVQRHLGGPPGVAAPATAMRTWAACTSGRS